MIQLWPVDPLVRAYPDQRPPRRPAPAVQVLAARGAVESAQFALRLDADAEAVRIEIEPPRRAGGPGALEGVTWRRAEFVPVRRPGFCVDEADRQRPFPSFVPDPLLDAAALAAAYSQADWAGANLRAWYANTCFPIWLTLNVPADAAPGDYAGRIVVTAGGESAALPLQVTVSPAVCPAARTLKLTQWFWPANIAAAASAAPWGEPHWQALRLWADDLASHRANVVLTPLELIALARSAEGRLAADFARFDRWVELFIAAGAIGYIEGHHLATRCGKWEEGFGLTSFPVRRPDGSLEDVKAEPVESPRARRFLAEFLPLLQEHLRRRGWLAIYYQHLADEPCPENVDSYRSLAATVKEAAPLLRRTDAMIRDERLIGTVECWCPQSHWVENRPEFYRARQAAGEEVWHYTCLLPNGSYPNRFLNQPLLGMRLLHWYNYTAGLTGYLHWGFNYWGSAGGGRLAWCDTEATSPVGCQGLPAGDSHIVYPGPDGRPLDSIRHETCLEGVQDYELLKVLDAAQPGRAMKLARSVLPSLREYERRPARFRAARRRLLAAVAAVQRA